MAFDGSGNFNRTQNWQRDAATGVKIKADLHDDEDQNLADGIGNCIARDGQSTITGNISFNNKKITNLATGTAGSDAVNLTQLNGLKTFTEAITISGTDAKGTITFSGSQSPSADTNSRPLGLRFTQADLFFGVKPALYPGGSDVPRWVWNDNATGTGADKMTLTDGGLLTINSASSGYMLDLISTSTSGSSYGPDLRLIRRSTTRADGDALGSLRFWGRNDANSDSEYAQVLVNAADTATNAHDGAMALRVAVNGAMSTRITMNETGTTVSGKFLCGDIDATNLKSIGNTTVEATDDGSGVAPYLIIDRISASPAAVDSLGTILFRGRDSTTSSPTTGIADYAKIAASIISPTNNTEAGKLVISLLNGANGVYNAIVMEGTAGDNKTTIAGLSASSADLPNPVMSGSAVLERSDDTASTGPYLLIDRISLSPAAGDNMGNITFRGRNSATTLVNYAGIASQIGSATSGAQIGKMYLSAYRNATSTTFITIDGTPTTGGVTIDELKATDAELTAPRIINNIWTTSTDTGAGVGPFLVLHRDSTSPAVNDAIGAVYFRGQDSSTAVCDYALISTEIESPTNTTEKGRLKLQVKRNGSMIDAITIDNTDTTISGPLNTGTLACGPITSSGTGGITCADGMIIGEGFRNTGAAYSIWSEAATTGVNFYNAAGTTLRGQLGYQTVAGDITIKTNMDATDRIWTFADDGVTTFPAGIFCLAVNIGTSWFSTTSDSYTQWIINQADGIQRGAFGYSMASNHAVIAANVNVTARNWYFKADGAAQKLTAGQWDAISDARIKQVNGDYDTGLAAIRALQVRRFEYLGNDFVEGPEDAEGKTTPVSPHADMQGIEIVGFIAQEIEAVMPDCVKQGPGNIGGEEVTDLRTVDQTNVMFALVNAVKELADRLETIEEKVAA